MAYGCTIEKMLDVLAVTTPAEIAILRDKIAHVEHGLLSLGLKIHGLKITLGYRSFFAQLGGMQDVLERNVYKRSGDEFCLVLPPLGSAQAAILLLNCIATRTGTPMFNSPCIQLQVCSPGRLDARRSALLAIAFYLGSDTVRQYTLTDFTTTVSYDDRYRRGRRIVIYDAGTLGCFERGFSWWARTPFLTVHPMLPFEEPLRSDVLTGPCSTLDIKNINLIATLLVHAQYHEYVGCWHKIGRSFEEELVSILKAHLMEGLLSAPWVHADGEPDITEDREFFGALQELTSYAREEVVRMSKIPSRFGRLVGTPKPGILDEVRTLLETYRAIVYAQQQPGGYSDAR